MQINKKIVNLYLYIILLMFSASMFVACGDLVVEVQQTQRVHSSAARNPIAIDSESQGSTRTQDKSPTGVAIDAKATVNETQTVGGGSLFGSDVTGPEN